VQVEGWYISRDSRTVSFGSPCVASGHQSCCYVHAKDARPLSTGFAFAPRFRRSQFLLSRQKKFHSTAAKEISYYMLVPIDGRSPEILLERG